MHESTPAIGVIGGSGLYQIEGLEEITEHRIDTPYGEPSDVIHGGVLERRRVFFLPRHGRGHRILPSELNHRANIWALRSLGVRWLISVSAVGSLQEAYRPRHILLPDQFLDRTSRRGEYTFFGRGIVGHIAFADPVSVSLRALLETAAKETGITVHNGGTYVNMDGPAFSTRAESQANHQAGHDVIGMTQVAEAKLAREAEIAMATLALVTDYDCWKQDEEHVTAEMVIGHVRANAEAAKRILSSVLPRIPAAPDWPEHRALDGAIMTDKSLWPPETVANLKPILGRFLD